MSGVPANIYILCRLCGCETTDRHGIHIFDVQGKLRDIHLKLTLCLPLHVTETDCLPKVLCIECVNKLESYYEFRKNSLKTACYLQELVNKSLWPIVKEERPDNSGDTTINLAEDDPAQFCLQATQEYQNKLQEYQNKYKKKEAEVSVVGECSLASLVESRLEVEPVATVDNSTKWSAPEPKPVAEPEKPEPTPIKETPAKRKRGPKPKAKNGKPEAPRRGPGRKPRKQAKVESPKEAAVKEEPEKDNTSSEMPPTIEITDEMDVFNDLQDSPECDELPEPEPLPPMKPAPKIKKEKSDQKYCCEVCGKVFSTKGNLGIHLRIHSAEKPFKCPQCDYRGVQKAQLQTHMLRHTGVKMFLCEECGRSFARKHILTDHIRTHTGEKPFQCKVCAFRCAQYGTLVNHMRSH